MSDIGEPIEEEDLEPLQVPKIVPRKEREPEPVPA